MGDALLSSPRQGQMNGPHRHLCKTSLLLSLFLSSTSLMQEIPNAVLPQAVSQLSIDGRMVNLRLDEDFQEGIIVQK